MHRPLTLRLALLGALAMTPVIAFSQNSFWQIPDGKSPAALFAPAKSFRTYQLNLTNLRADISVADASARNSKQVVSLPLPDGRFVEVALTPAAVLTPEMQAQHPEIQTFKGTSADGAYSVRFTVSTYGAFARIQTPDNGLVYIQPLNNASPEWSVVYYSRDIEDLPEGVRCGVTSEEVEEITSSKTAAFTYGDANLRTYVLAVAASGEYTAWAGGQAQALTQITATISNVNAIYERDLGVTFILTSPADIRYTDAATDPYSTTLDATLLNDNHTNITNLVGLSNYALGHLFSAQNWGGLAYGGVVCNPNYKGGAASGLANPTGAAFEKVVAHEIGHQFGAAHTFSASNAGCGSNISASTGWEPGGGSTIMAYAGSCTGNFYQANSDLYFHGGSLSQMGAFMTFTGNTCATLSTPANTAPTISVTPLSYTIPHSTAFRLSASGTDANNSELTYTFEQENAVGGTGTSTPPVSTSVSGPLFRSYPPSTSSTRYFPILSAQLTNTSTPYEVLPTIANRTMNFRATLRDNNAGFGRTAAEDVTVVTGAYGPFQITSQSTPSSFTANGTNQMTVSWDPADAAGCPNVTLKYTRDGGSTFTTLLASTANDGSETFTVPNLPSCAGRMLLECSNNIYYDVNGADISIASGCGANGATISPATAMTVASAGDPALSQSLTPQYGVQITSPISGSIATTDPTSNLAFYATHSSSCGGPSNPNRYDVYTFQPGTTATYTFNGTGSPFGLVYNIYRGTFNPTSVCNSLLMSSATQATSGGALSLSDMVSAPLCAGSTYSLVVSSFSGAQPTLPASYSVAITGGTIHSGSPNPGAGFNYSYVIVDNTSGNIASIQSTGDMTNSITFPTGTYTVHGISASNSSSLASFVGGSFSTLQTAVLNQGGDGSLCASMSSNSRQVTVGSVPLPINDLRFEASLTGRRSARTEWTVSSEASNTTAYQIERSYDGQRFDIVATQPTKGLARYEFAEDGLDENATGVHYRLATRKLGGGVQYVPSVYLAFEASATTPALVVAPNPVQGGILRAEVSAATAGRGTAMVLDATGRVVMTAPIALVAGKHAIELPVHGLSAGVYLLRVDGAGAALQVRFVKSR